MDNMQIYLFKGLIMAKLLPIPKAESFHILSANKLRILLRTTPKEPYTLLRKISTMTTNLRTIDQGLMNTNVNIVMMKT